jgi:hypothetical protein
LNIEYWIHDRDRKNLSPQTAFYLRWLIGERETYFRLQTSEAIGPMVVVLKTEPSRGCTVGKGWGRALNGAMSRICN